MHNNFLLWDKTSQVTTRSSLELVFMKCASSEIRIQKITWKLTRWDYGTQHLYTHILLDPAHPCNKKKKVSYNCISCHRRKPRTNRDVLWSQSSSRKHIFEQIGEKSALVFMSMSFVIITMKQ